MNEATTKRRLVLLAPAGRVFDALVTEAIQPCLAERGFELDRLPTGFQARGLCADLRRRLERGDGVLADLTGRNPHVLYLLGLADALAKPSVLMICHAEEFPFAPEERPPIVYAGRPEVLRAELGAVLGRQWDSSVGGYSTPLAGAPTPGDSARTRFDAIFGDLLEAHGYAHSGTVRLEAENVFVLEEQEMELALVQALARRARERRLRLKLL